MSAEPARIGLIGAGWRANAFLRVAAAAPERFVVRAALTRTQSRADAVSREWPVPVHTDAERFFSSGPFDFVVILVPADQVALMLRMCVDRDMPALIETPPASSLEGLRELHGWLPEGARVQVAEQYRLQPHHAARLALVESGLIGTPSAAHVSVAHDYHGISLMRALLDVGFEQVQITARTVRDPVTRTIGRDGWVARPEVIDDLRVMAWLSFVESGKSGTYEFGGEQYFSPIRTRHISVRGEKGELIDDSVHFLRGAEDDAHLTLARDDTGVDGDLRGSYLRRITLGERTLYTNPLTSARLSDDEVAIGTTLLQMRAYAAGGDDFYSVADASHDAYLAHLIHHAEASQQVVQSQRQSWARTRTRQKRST